MTKVKYVGKKPFAETVFMNRVVQEGEVFDVSDAAAEVLLVNSKYWVADGDAPKLAEIKVETKKKSKNTEDK